jgi:membrane protease YdiL (CAAX protease family)
VTESGILFYAVTIYLGLSAGLVEEFLFRDLLYRTFSGFRHSLALFLVISSILFSLVHWENGLANLAATYIFGVFMAIDYLGLHNLWSLVIGHNLYRPGVVRLMCCGSAIHDTPVEVGKND